MSTKIILKKSNTAGAVPLTTDLEIGEVALNLADRKLYTKNNSGSVVVVGAAYVGSTAPSGPAEGDLWYDSVANALKAYNGTAWAATGYSTLASLEDTLISSVASGEVLVWNGTSWANNTLAEASISAVGHTHTSSSITDFTEAAQDAVGSIISGTGIATVTYNDTAGTIVVNAVEADTLDTVTGRGATTANGITVGSVETTGDVTVGGNLIVNGTTTTVNSNEVNIGDAVILLNSDEAGSPSQNAGIEIERGTSANVSFLWDETNDRWSLGDLELADVVLNGGTY